MSSKGFHIQYKVMDKSPIAICYTLILTYQECIEHRVDVSLPSMHISHEIIFSIERTPSCYPRLKFSHIKQFSHFVK